jgi:diadenosine tetraphosphate (Ap4A) HIT family hydrolase
MQTNTEHCSYIVRVFGIWFCYNHWRMKKTLFDEIIAGDVERYVVWEDSRYLAFLTPYPNTPGVTIVIPKANPGDYVFALSDDAYTGLLAATKTVAHIMEKALAVKRVAMVFEGTGVAHVHAKLYPLYGPYADLTDVWSEETEFTTEYRKYLTTLQGPRMDGVQLKELQDKMRAVQ